MARLPLTNGLTTRVECSFFVNSTGAMCPGKATLSPRFPFPVPCDPLQPFQLWADGGGWKPSVFAKTGMTFTTTMPTAQCELGMTGASSSANPLQGLFPSVIMIPLANGRYGALPLHINVKPVSNGLGCDDPINTNSCVIEGESTIPPSLMQCLTSDVIQPW
jgi:hypothetical protein